MEYRLGIYEKAMPPRLEFKTMLSAARDAGFDFMEISIDETDERQARLDWGEVEKKDMIYAFHATGMQIDTMCLSGHRKYPLGSHDAEKRARGMEMLKKAVLISESLGIRLIQLAGYDVYYEESDADTRRWFGENLAEGVRFAAAHGVAMGFETMETPFMDTISKAMRYVREIDSPYLGVYPDLGNLTNACRIYESEVAEEIDCGHGHLMAMHIKETEEGKYRDMRFGTGQVDFAQGIRRALDAGVRMFVAECWHDGRDDWRGAIREVNNFVRERFAQAAQL